LFSGYYFTAQSFSSANLPIDQTVVNGSSTVTDLSSAEFYLSCSTNISRYHCKTCLANGQCLSCYQQTTIASTLYTFNNYNYLQSDGTCVTQCTPGFYIDTPTNSCIQCSSQCSTCQTSSTTCLTCVQTSSTNKYYGNNKTCLSSCPNGYYANSGNICLQCSSSCATCQTDQFTCTSCNGSSFLNSNTKICVSSTSCPTNTYADISTSKCLACDSSCLECIGVSTNCSSCANGYIRDTTTNTTLKLCTNHCPPGTVNDTTNNLGCRC
jgi:proprotein convertase subtilisin/kexin type 5